MEKELKQKIESYLGGEEPVLIIVEDGDKVIVRNHQNREERDVLSGTADVLKVISDWINVKHKESKENIEDRERTVIHITTRKVVRR